MGGYQGPDPDIVDILPLVAGAGRMRSAAVAGARGGRVDDPVERLLADAVPTGRRESPKHVTPAHQAGREAAQI